jgi:hypothetical protein
MDNLNIYTKKQSLYYSGGPIIIHKYDYLPVYLAQLAIFGGTGLVHHFNNCNYKLTILHINSCAINSLTCLPYLTILTFKFCVVRDTNFAYYWAKTLQGMCCQFDIPIIIYKLPIRTIKWTYYNEYLHSCFNTPITTLPIQVLCLLGGIYTMNKIQFTVA